MRRCARGRGRESPKKVVKRKEEKKGESWRAFLVTFRLFDAIFIVSSSPSPILLFHDPRLRANLSHLPRHSPLVTSSSENSHYPLSTCSRNEIPARRFFIRGISGDYSRKARPFPRNFSDFGRPMSSLLIKSLNRTAIEFFSNQDIEGPE